MLFNSLEFLVFGVVFFAAWRLLRGLRLARWLFLIAASLFFYGWWDWRYIFLLVWTGLVDYTAGLLMGRYPERKKLWLVLSLCGNVGTLATFKYLGFLTTSVNATLSFFGAAYQLPVYELLLPVGISFYTFESLSYTIDIYKGLCAPTRNIVKFFGFLTLFPHLVAGPVIRPADLMPQLEADKAATRDQIWGGLKLIAVGYFKKVVIADRLAPVVNSAFGVAEPQHSALYWWVIVTMFAFQIYCDFSGYTDIARGLAKWMGYEFPVNFNHPYISTSLREFWTRWHISLSSWFRDYVYIPLGGSRGGTFASHRNMWLTMVVSGLWHGAAWHFVIWGALHAFYTSLERVTEWPRRLGRLPGGRALVTIVCLIFVWIGWVFFRAMNVGQAASIVGLMFGSNGWTHSGVLSATLEALPVLLLAIVWELWYWLRLDQAPIAHGPLAKYVEPVLVALLLAASVYFRGTGNAFIYFQF